jgi:hypothetical protein
LILQFGIFWPQNGSHCCADFVPKPFKILEMAPFRDFQGLISYCPATFTGLRITGLALSHHSSELLAFFSLWQVNIKISYTWDSFQPNNSRR